MLPETSSKGPGIWVPGGVVPGYRSTGPGYGSWVPVYGSWLRVLGTWHRVLYMAFLDDDRVQDTVRSVHRSDSTLNHGYLPVCYIEVTLYLGTLSHLDTGCCLTRSTTAGYRGGAGGVPGRPYLPDRTHIGPYGPYLTHMDPY